MADIKMYTIVDPRDPLGNTKIGFQRSLEVSTVLESYAIKKLVDEIMKQVAERFVAENYSLIAAKLDPQAIGNLALAEAGKQIAEQIRSSSSGIVPKTITINFEENHDDTTKGNEALAPETGGYICCEPGNPNSHDHQTGQGSQIKLRGLVLSTKDMERMPFEKLETLYLRAKESRDKS